VTVIFVKLKQNQQVNGRTLSITDMYPITCPPTLCIDYERPCFLVTSTVSP